MSTTASAAASVRAARPGTSADTFRAGSEVGNQPPALAQLEGDQDPLAGRQGAQAIDLALPRGVGALARALAGVTLGAV
jgi:hypothetical protein